jgi:hypothetical protein
LETTFRVRCKCGAHRSLLPSCIDS